VTKIKEPTPDGPGKGGGGPLLKKRAGRQFFRGMGGDPWGGGVIVKGGSPFCVREGGGTHSLILSEGGRIEI